MDGWMEPQDDNGDGDVDYCWREKIYIQSSLQSGEDGRWPMANDLRPMADGQLPMADG